MKRKYREAMRAAARERNQQPDDDAKEARDWFDEWAMKPPQQDEQPKSQQQN